MVFFSLFLILGSFSAAQEVEGPLPYTDTNSVQALRNLEKASARDPKQLQESEGVVWARARFAWIALLRLEGKEEEAKAVFAGCGIYCEMWGPGKEWPALRAWGCAKNKNAETCKKLK